MFWLLEFGVPFQTKPSTASDMVSFEFSSIALSIFAANSTFPHHAYKIEMH